MYYESFTEFRIACRKFFHKRVWRSYKEALDSLRTDNFQINDAYLKKLEVRACVAIERSSGWGRQI